MDVVGCANTIGLEKEIRGGVGFECQGVDCVIITDNIGYPSIWINALHNEGG